MSTVTTKQQRLTPEDLLKMPDGDRYDLVDGEIVENFASGSDACKVEATLCALLLIYCRKHNLGTVFPASMGYRCFPDDPNRIRHPDASYVSFEKFPARSPNVGYMTVVPDLVAEVVSPNDLAYDLERKIEEYLTAGVQLIWILYPETQRVHVLRPDGTNTSYSRHQTLSGEQIIPGFTCRVGDLFLQEWPETEKVTKAL